MLGLRVGALVPRLVHREAGELEPALAAAHHAVALCHGPNNFRPYALFEIGATCLARGDVVGALSPLIEAHATAVQRQDADLQLACLTEEAALYRLLGAPTVALLWQWPPINELLTRTLPPAAEDAPPLWEALRGETPAAEPGWGR